MLISVVYAKPGKQLWVHLDLDEGVTALYAIARSGILGKCPEIDLDLQKVGIYGKLCNLDTVLRDGDRVEIYRKITADPKTVKRRAGSEAD